MRQLILYTSFGHENLEEFYRIDLDINLNVNTKPILYENICNKLKNFGSTLKCKNPLTLEEFNFMLEKATGTHGYDLGCSYPTRVNCKIRSSVPKNSLQKIYLEKMLE